MRISKWNSEKRIGIKGGSSQTPSKSVIEKSKSVEPTIRVFPPDIITPNELRNGRAGFLSELEKENVLLEEELNSIIISSSKVRNTFPSREQKLKMEGMQDMRKEWLATNTAPVSGRERNDPLVQTIPHTNKLSHNYTQRPPIPHKLPNICENYSHKGGNPQQNFVNYVQENKQLNKIHIFSPVEQEKPSIQASRSVHNSMYVCTYIHIYIYIY